MVFLSVLCMLILIFTWIVSLMRICSFDWLINGAISYFASSGRLIRFGRFQTRKIQP